MTAPSPDTPPGTPPDTPRVAAALDQLPDPGRMTARQALGYAGYRAAWAAFARIPLGKAEPAAARIGAAWHRFGSDKQRAQVRANMARVCPDTRGTDLDALVRDAYASYARYWIDSFRLHRLSAAQVLDNTTIHNAEDVDALTADGQGAIMATAHLGSWDVGAFFTTQRDWRMAVVAEVVEPRPLFDRFVKLREDAGLAVVPLVRGGDMLDRMEKLINAGRLATLLADRDLNRKGPVVNFMGEPCRLPPGVSILARRTRKPVAIAAFLTEGEGFKAHIHDVVDIADLDVEAGTQVIADKLGELIRLYPAQWHVFVRNWLADREPDHPALAGTQD